MTDNSNKRPLVTAVITNYKRFSEAKRAILSAFNQSYKNLEIIVVEDGSASGIEEWLTEKNFHNVYYKGLKKNHGLSFARNTALKLARGKYISFLDDDDEWKINRIEFLINRVIGLAEDKKIDFGVIHSSLETNFPDSSRRPKILLAANQGNLKNAIIKEGIQTISSSPLFSRDALLRVGGYDEALASGIDHDIWMSIAVNGFQCETVVEPLVVSYSRLNRITMMNDIDARIEGVTHFVKKWQPVFIEWHGKGRGIQWAQKYHADVIGYLLGFKIAIRDKRGAKKCIQQIFYFSHNWEYNFKIILKSFLRGIVKRVD